MELTIRRALPSDALFLTSISFGAKRYWNYSEEYFEACHDQLTITEDYIKQNVVYVAQKEDTIIGYFSIFQVKEEYWKGEVLVREGYWLDHIYIRPAYIRSGIGTELMTYAQHYCRQNGIEVLHIFSDSFTNEFYEKLGATCMGEVPSSIEDRTVSVYDYHILDKISERPKEENKNPKIILQEDEREQKTNTLFDIPIDAVRYRSIKRAYEKLNQKFSELDKEFNDDFQDIQEIAEETSLYTISLQKAEIDGNEYVDDRDELLESDREIQIPKLQLDEAEIAALIAPTVEDVDQSCKEESIYIATEKEKMLAGELYIAWGDEFINDKRRVRKLLREFNNTHVEDKKSTIKILKELFGSTGESIHIEPQFKCDYGYNIHIGDNFYASYDCVILDSSEVRIGNNCILSPQVGIYTSTYPLNAEKRAIGYEYAKPVTIGNNVWIGGGSIINPGVTIGDNVVITPGSVVIEDIPDNVLVGGNPAKVIKEIETEI